MTKESLKAWVKKHPRINLTQYLLRKVYTSTSACNDLLNYKDDPLCIQYRHYGEANSGIIIYFILVDYDICGYCSLLRFTLLYLAYADRFRFIPSVTWTERTLYADGTRQGFEYFFNPINSLTREEIMSSDLVVISKDADINLIVPTINYYLDDEEITILSKMTKKYLSFNYEGEKIKKSVNTLLNQRNVLGVHIRRTDFLQNFNRHPVAVSFKEYTDKIDELLSSKKYDFVFLATDEQNILNEMKNRYNDKLLYFEETYRSKDGRPIHYGKDRKKQSGLKLAADILKETYALGYCSGLCAGLSNVSAMARAFRRASGIEYKDLIILEHGLNTNMKESRFFIRNKGKVIGREYYNNKT